MALASDALSTGTIADEPISVASAAPPSRFT
jgi:hypothetical protein